MLPNSKMESSQAMPPKQLKVAIIGTVGLPASYGGFETLVHYLVEYLGKDFSFTVYCSGPDYKEKPKTFLQATLVYFPLRANGAQSILFDFCNYLHAWWHADILLVLGVSGGLALPLTRIFRKPTILNIGGLDWQRRKWGRWASRFLHFSEAVAVRSANINVSDNQGIGDYLQKSYGRKSTLIEYGGDQITSPEIENEHRLKYNFLQSAYVFSVARIQADNNPDVLLEAFSKVTNKTFVFVGNWDRTPYGRDLKIQYQNFQHLHLLEAIYDAKELNMLRCHAALYIHGHSAGGTNPSLVEAMHLSLPIAAFNVIYNRATTENIACYFSNATELVKLLNEVRQEEWDKQRTLLKTIAIRRYRWERIAQEYAKLFQSFPKYLKKNVSPKVFS